MKAVPEIKQELRNALPALGIKDTILSIKKYLPDHSEKFKSLLLIESRYRDFEQRMLQGVMSADDIRLDTNQIRADLLTFIDSFEDADFEAAPAEPAEPAKAKSGKILYRIPDTMQVDEETKCIIRVAFTEEDLLENLEIESVDQIKSIRVSEAMAAQVIDPNSEPAFEIRTFSEEIQFVEEDYFTEWLFYVKPLLKGTFSLLLKISVIEIKMGKERKRDIVMEERVVITTEPVEEEEAVFKEAEEELVSPYAPIQSRGIEPTSAPSASKPAKKRSVVGLGKAIASIGKILMIGGLVIGSIAVLNYNFNGVSPNEGFAEHVPPPPPPSINIPTFPEPTHPDHVIVEPSVEADMAAVESRTITEYKDDLIAYVNKHESDASYAVELVTLKKKIQYLEYQEALIDSTSVEVLDYLEKYTADSLNCLYCHQAIELKSYRAGQDEFRTTQKLDALLRYLQSYPKGKYRIPAIKSIEKVKPDTDFPIVIDSIKWDTERLELTFLKGAPPFDIIIKPSNIGQPDITINKTQAPILIPFAVPNLEEAKGVLEIKDSRGSKTLLPLNKKTLDQVARLDAQEITSTDPPQIDPPTDPNEGENTPEEAEPLESEKLEQERLERERLEKLEQTRLKEIEEVNLAELERARLAELEQKEKENIDIKKTLPKLPEEVLVKKGRFTMGSNIGDKHEKPVHAVNIKRDFYIYQTETTFKSYDAYCAATNTTKPSDKNWGRGNRPVINVSWLDAVKYCNWLTEQYPQLTPVYDIQGQNVKINSAANGFRLPTEAEWEYAAKGGHQLKNNHKYAGSLNDWKSVAYHNLLKTGTVKSKAPNSIGIYDMSGNVYEWTQDYWAENYNNTPKDGSAYLQNKNGNDHTIRGGRFKSKPSLLRVTHRSLEVQNAKREGVGFRVARFTY